MKAVALFVVFCFAVQILAVDDKTCRSMFQDWMKEHNKVYTKAGEKEMRFINFKNTLKRIERNSAKFTAAKFGLNKFSDMSEREFFRTRTGPKYPSQALARSCLANGVTAVQMDVHAIPASYDWRTQNKVTRVKDQGQCGSCWAFSTIGNIESQWAIKGHALTEFSEQLIVDCSHACVNEPPYGNVCNQGCDGGWQWSAFTDVMSWGGVETETQYPYTAETGTCNINNKLLTAAIKNYTCMTDPNHNGVSEDQMAAYLVAKGPLSIAMDATPLMDYTSGILNPGPDDCSTTQLDHALLIVGYGVDSTQSMPFWIVKNSWATSWGEQGYFRIYRGSGACGINNAVSIAVM